jgi:hypothetical protein
MSEETLRKLCLQVRNWGKWGPDDEIGTLNYITPARIAAAARLVTRGTVIALGIPLQRQGPQSGTRARFNPKSWPPTAPATGGGSSCWSRRRSPSRAGWGRPSTRMR